MLRTVAAQEPGMPAKMAASYCIEEVALFIHHLPLDHQVDHFPASSSSSRLNLLFCEYKIRWFPPPLVEYIVQTQAICSQSITCVNAPSRKWTRLNVLCECITESHNIIPFTQK